MSKFSTCSTICSVLYIIIMVLEVSTTYAAGDGECIAPVPLPVFHHGDADLAAALNRMQCELGCIKENGVTLTQLDSETGWPSIEFDSLQDNNCPLYQKVQGCKAGCLRRFSEPTVPINRCRDSCYTHCTNELCDREDSCQHQVDLICPKQCRKTYCKFGCLVHDTIEASVTSNSNSLPAQSSSPPILEHITDSSKDQRRLYTINTRTTIPTARVSSSSTSSNHSQYPVAYLLRISSPGTSILRYVWQRNLSSPLDLSPFTCSSVSISFAIVTQLTSPTSVHFSTETTVAVPGLGGRPAQVNKNSMSVHFSEDYRDGFLGYSVANLSWTRPNGSEFLTSYQIRVFPGSDDVNCGGGNDTRYVYSTIDKEATYFVIQAERPNGLMKFGCSYIFEILAYPTNELIGTFNDFISELTGPPPVMSLNCQRIWDSEGYFNISLNWSFPEAAQISHITQFVVTPMLPNRVPIGSSHFLSRTEEWLNDFSMTLSSFQPQVDNTERLTIEVKSVINASYTWRNLPRTQSCTIKTSPISPYPPRDILIRNILFDDTNKRLTLNVKWKPPTAAHGVLTKYELFIGEEAHVQSSEESRGFVKLFEDATTETEINRVVLNISEDIHCLQLQMRAYNNYSLASNWSEPLVIPLNDECRIGPNNAANVSTNNSSGTDVESAKGNIAVYLEREEVGSVKLIELGCNSDSTLFGASEDNISAQLSSLGERVDSVLSQVLSNQQVEDKVVSLQEKLNNIEHKLDVLMDFVAQRVNQET